jgi:hypothetical protein
MDMLSATLLKMTSQVIQTLSLGAKELHPALNTDH